MSNRKPNGHITMSELSQELVDDLQSQLGGSGGGIPGPQGPKGDKGDTGAQGAVGPNAVSISTSTTGFTNGHIIYNNNGKIGAKVLDKSTVGLSNVNNWGASTAINSTSTTTYATASAVKQAYDRANQAFQSASDGKVKVANAITAKGVQTSTTAEFATMASNISKLNTYTEQSAILSVLRPIGALTSDPIDGTTAQNMLNKTYDNQPIFVLMQQNVTYTTQDYTYIVFGTRNIGGQGDPSKCITSGVSLLESKDKIDANDASSGLIVGYRIYKLTGNVKLALRYSGNVPLLVKKSLHGALIS